MSKTIDRLKAAFAGESQANRRYLAFAKKAEQDGKPGLAKLFRATAEGETVHALNHLRNLKEVKDSIENIKMAISGETYEIETMYPEFLATAQEEGEKSAENSFQIALEVEKVHQKMFQNALETLETGEDLPEGNYYICPVCGYLESPEAPEKCPICGTPKEKFYRIS